MYPFESRYLFFLMNVHLALEQSELLTPMLQYSRLLGYSFVLDKIPMILVYLSNSFGPRSATNFSFILEYSFVLESRAILLAIALLAFVHLSVDIILFGFIAVPFLILRLRALIRAQHRVRLALFPLGARYFFYFGIIYQIILPRKSTRMSWCRMPSSRPRDR